MIISSSSISSFMSSCLLIICCTQRDMQQDEMPNMLKIRFDHACHVIRCV